MSMGAAAASGGRKRRRAMADINVTPLVDVMLVLLVIFMITAPALDKDSIDVGLPRARVGAGGGQTVAPLSLAIDSQGRVHCAGRVLSPQEAPGELPKLLRGHEKEMLTLKAHRALPYESVVKIIAVVRACGISGISIAVDRE